jgi:hypothetical protein
MPSGQAMTPMRGMTEKMAARMPNTMAAVPGLLRSSRTTICGAGL